MERAAEWAVRRGAVRQCLPGSAGGAQCRRTGFARAAMAALRRRRVRRSQPAERHRPTTCRVGQAPPANMHVAAAAQIAIGHARVDGDSLVARSVIATVSPNSDSSRYGCPDAPLDKTASARTAAYAAGHGWRPRLAGLPALASDRPELRADTPGSAWFANRSIGRCVLRRHGKSPLAFGHRCRHDAARTSVCETSPLALRWVDRRIFAGHGSDEGDTPCYGSSRWSVFHLGGPADGKYGER
jgi:hypothetical protein